MMSDMGGLLLPKNSSKEMILFSAALSRPASLSPANR